MFASRLRSASDAEYQSRARTPFGDGRLESKEAAIRHMGDGGADLATTEMVVFEWLQTAGHPRFRDVLALIE